MAAFKATSTDISRKEGLTEQKDIEKDLAENVESNQSTDVIGAGLQVIDSSETRPLKCFKKISCLPVVSQKIIFISAYSKSDRQSSHRD